MYTKKHIANNKIVLIAIVIIYVLLIFPIFIRVNLTLKTDKEPIFYSVYIFNCINVLSGFIRLYSSYLINNINYKKEKIIPYTSLLNVQNKMKYLHDFHILKITSVINIGLKKNMEFMLYFGFVLNFIFENIVKAVKEYKNYVKTNYYINLIEKEKNFESNFSIGVVINGLTIIISLVKFILEKIKNGKIAKKQNRCRGGNFVK